MTTHWKAVEQCFTAVVFSFTQFVNLENLSVLDLALSPVMGLINMDVTGPAERIRNLLYSTPHTKYGFSQSTLGSWIVKHCRQKIYMGTHMNLNIEFWNLKFQN